MRDVPLLVSHNASNRSLSQKEYLVEGKKTLVLAVDSEKGD